MGEVKCPDCGGTVQEYEIKLILGDKDFEDLSNYISQRIIMGNNNLVKC